MSGNLKCAVVVCCLALCLCPFAAAQEAPSRTIAGVVLTPQNEVVPGVSVLARHASGERRAETDGEGAFRLAVPAGPVTLSFEGRGIAPLERAIGAGENAEGLRIRVTFVVPPVHESVVIEATALDPSIDRRNAAVYEDTLFARDDQLLQRARRGHQRRPARGRRQVARSPPLRLQPRPRRRRRRAEGARR
jgi:hypothetical protein